MLLFCKSYGIWHLSKFLCGVFLVIVYFLTRQNVLFRVFFVFRTPGFKHIFSTFHNLHNLFFSQSGTSVLGALNAITQLFRRPSDSRKKVKFEKILEPSQKPRQKHFFFFICSTNILRKCMYFFPLHFFHQCSVEFLLIFPGFPLHFIANPTSRRYPGRKKEKGKFDQKL